jgi:UDP:flavonoid glycosyltransferase YjiC (YdhE family)
VTEVDAVRVLFTVSSWPTHYAAMVPIGWAMQAVGHDVRVLCAPSQAEPVCRAGLTAVPVLGGMSVAVRNRLQYYQEAVDGIWPYPWLPLHPMTGEPLASLEDFDLKDYRRRTQPEFNRQAARSFDAAVDYGRRWRPDLVLHDPAVLEGILLGRVLDIPAVLCLWGPVGTEEPEHMRIVPPDDSGSFPRYGLDEFTLDMVEHVVDPCPSSLAPPTAAKRLPVRFVPYNGPFSAPAWLLEPPERRRVCVSWSTALSTMSGPHTRILPMLAHALADSGFEVVITATAEDVATIGQLPSNVRLVERLPLRALLQTCDAVVHHGGSGTTMTAVHAGLPQLAVTFASEQTATGTRLAASYAGLHVPGHLAGRETVAATVRQLVADPIHRDSARALRTELLGRPTAVDVVAALDQLRN